MTMMLNRFGVHFLYIDALTTCSILVRSCTWFFFSERSWELLRSREGCRAVADGSLNSYEIYLFA